MQGGVERVREDFLAGKSIEDKDIRKDILESWNYSKKANVNPMTLPPSEIIKGLKTSNIAAKSGDFLSGDFRSDCCMNILKPYYDLLTNTNAAILYADTDLNIINQRGNTQLLSRLESLNLGIGASLKEESVGTNAAALTFRNHQDSYVLGSEHYIEALQDFATCSCELCELDGYTPYCYYVFITPKTNFNEYQLTLLRYAKDLTLYKLNSVWNESQQIMSNDQKQFSHEGMIFVDKNGFITGANQWINENLRQVYLGQKLEDAIPELSAALKYIQEEKSFKLHGISTKRNKKTIAQGQPIKKQNKTVGTLITLSDHSFEGRQKNSNAPYTFDYLIGSNSNFVAVKEIAMQAAKSPSNILILGESGTGKELFAQAIHNASNFRNGPFISINCASIPRELISSELFGYAEGSFTGARKGGAPGKFELADNGTIFLDEIGDMPYDIQSVLLRTLEERAVNKIGSNRPVPINVRVISATNQNLWQNVLSKEFRLDLFYRLNVIQITIPPLRERLDDIPLLVDFYLKYFNGMLNKNILGITSEVIHIFKNYYWPGNIREFRNTLESAAVLCNSELISSDVLTPQLFKSSIIQKQTITSDTYNSLNILSEDVTKNLIKKHEKKMNEKKEILDLLKKHNGNKTQVAKELGITRVTLYNKLQYK